MNNKTNEIKRNIDGNTMETYNYNNGNSNNNFKYPKFISFFINNRSNHFKQLTKVVIMIPNIFNNAEIGDILSLLIEIYNYNNGNSKSNFRHLKLISFFINNRLGHLKQFTKVVMMIQSVFNDAKIGNVLKY